MKIEIYTNDTCSYCKQIKEELNKNSIKYKEKDTKQHSVAFGDVTNLVNMGNVPLLVINDTNYLLPARDFNSPQHLTAILNNFVDPSFDDTKACLEKIKTLNYHIGIAFNNLDNILKQIENKIK